WLGWDGVTWRDDLDAAVPGLIRGVCVTAANKVARMGLTPAEQAKFLSIAKGLSSQRQIQACEVLCRNDRRLRISSQKLNTHRDLLGTPAGIVDLPSGVMLPADPQLYMTRQTAVVPRMEDCPTWIRFLKDVAQGDMDYVAYLQRLAGYFLTGRTDEHSLWYMWGPGGNGKSTFLGVLEHLMGQYARTASMDVFVASEFSRHPTELAALAGSRMVMASEIREGQTWDEGRIKSLTGGDRVTARFLYQDEFEYVPEFKLALVGNAKPKLARVDDAVKRRFHLLPFIFKPAVPNTSLMDTLRAESPAILWWAIRGAKDWYSGGLRPPKVVLAASEEYMERNDPIGRFVRECTSDSARVEVQALYEAWSRWCDANGESAGSMKRFSQALEDRGFKRFRSSATGRMGFVGLAATASEFAGSAIQ
ncbi:MAG: phage/plasmid primase, P4 family, partial [Armatimonadia bacterium]